MSITTYQVQGYNLSSYQKSTPNSDGAKVTIFLYVQVFAKNFLDHQQNPVFGSCVDMG